MVSYFGVLPFWSYWPQKLTKNQIFKMSLIDKSRLSVYVTKVYIKYDFQLKLRISNAQKSRA